MRNCLCFIFVMQAVTTFSQQNYNVTLLDTVEFPGQVLANIWGYVDGNGNEYALVGAANGMYVIDVTDPTNPVRKQQLTDGISSPWREIKTYQNHAYITSEGLDANSQGGLGVADLSVLPSTPIPFTKYKGDGPINNLLKRAHALQVDEAQGYAYIYGATGLANGGALCLDVADPGNPEYVGQYNGSYIHDGYAKNNTVYGSHIYGGYFSIINFTNKSSPVVVATKSTPNAFTHNTWPSENGNYLFTTDEKSGSYLTSYDISDPTDITELDRLQGTPGSGSIIHNTYILGNFAYSSWYRDGFTITDISRPTNMIQVAAYDTYFWATGNGFQGAWGIYPYLPSGNILVTNMTQSLASGGQGGVLYILSADLSNACFLEGTVTDENTGLPLFGASVEIDHTDPLNNSTTNTGGNYTTGQPTSGNFDVTFSKIGYTTLTLSANLVNGAVTILNAQMQELSLPLEMLGFSAAAAGENNLLVWQTAQEINTARHEIQRKTNPDEKWAAIGQVDAAGTTQARSEYQFLDETPAPESYYRLRTLDLDGSEYFSEVVSVTRPGTGFSIEKIHPVPSQGNLELTVVSDKWRQAKAVFGDVAGRMVFEKEIELLPGANTLPFTLPAHLPNGEYWAKIQDGNGGAPLAKFVLNR